MDTTINKMSTVKERMVKSCPGSQSTHVDRFDLVFDSAGEINTKIQVDMKVMLETVTGERKRLLQMVGVLLEQALFIIS